MRHLYREWPLLSSVPTADFEPAHFWVVLTWHLHPNISLPCPALGVP